MSRRRSLVRSRASRATVGTAVLSVVGQASTAGALALVARRTDIRDFGFVVAAAGIASLGVDLLDFGGAAGLARRTASRDAVGARPFARVRALYAAAFVSALVVVSALTRRPHALVVAEFGLYSAFACYTTGGYAVLRGRQRFILAAGLQALERITALVVVVGAYPRTHAGQLYPVGIALGAVVSAVALVWVEPNWRPWSRLADTGLTPAFRGFPAFAASGFVSDAQLLDTPIVAAVGGVGVASGFGIAARVTGPLGIPASALASVLLVRVAAEPTQRVWRRAAMAVGGLAVVSAPLLALLAIFAHRLLRLAFGPAYAGAAGCLRIYCVAMVFALMNAPMASMLQAVGRERLVARILAISVPTSLLIVGVGAGLGGQAGAAVGFLALQIELSCVLLVLIRREHGRFPPVPGSEPEGAGEHRVLMDELPGLWHPARGGVSGSSI